MANPSVPAAPDFSEATNGDETTLFLNISGSTWTEIGELDPEDGLTDLPGGEQSTYETTHMSSGAMKEFKKNKRREGTESDITGNLVLGSDSDAALQAAEDATGPIAYLIVLKQGDQTFDATGHALFMNLRRSNPGGAVRKFTITAQWLTPFNVSARA